MKIDMSPEAVTRRLQQVAQLRRTCLLLADSTAGREVRRRRSEDGKVRKVAAALGEDPNTGEAAKE